MSIISSVGVLHQFGVIGVIHGVIHYFISLE